MNQKRFFLLEISSNVLLETFYLTTDHFNHYHLCPIGILNLECVSFSQKHYCPSPMNEKLSN